MGSRKANKKSRRSRRMYGGWQFAKALGYPVEYDAKLKNLEMTDDNYNAYTLLSKNAPTLAALKSSDQSRYNTINSSITEMVNGADSYIANRKQFDTQIADLTTQFNNVKTQFDTVKTQFDTNKAPIENNYMSLLKQIYTNNSPIMGSTVTTNSTSKIIVPAPVPRAAPIPAPVPKITSVATPVPRIAPVPAPVPRAVPAPVPRAAPAPALTSKFPSASIKNPSLLSSSLPRK